MNINEEILYMVAPNIGLFLKPVIMIIIMAIIIFSSMNVVVGKCKTGKVEYIET